MHIRTCFKRPSTEGADVLSLGWHLDTSGFKAQVGLYSQTCANWYKYSVSLAARECLFLTQVSLHTSSNPFFDSTGDEQFHVPLSVWPVPIRMLSYDELSCAVILDYLQIMVSGSLEWQNLRCICPVSPNIYSKGRARNCMTFGLLSS